MKPLILITNDDGIQSPGLQAAIEAACDLGDLVIAAPHTQQTGMGRAFPRTKDLGIIEEVVLTSPMRPEGIIGYGVHGSPAYVAAHGILELSPRKPDLCISGINYGENLGMIPTCSGTVGAVIEAVSQGVPGIAISTQIPVERQRNNEFETLDWKKEKKILRIWCKKILEEGMPKGVDFFNINVPKKEASPGAYRRTTMSRQNYFEFIPPGKRSFDQPYELKSELKVDMDSLEKDSDIYAVYVDHMISITPMTCDMSVR